MWAVKPIFRSDAPSEIILHNYVAHNDETVRTVPIVADIETAALL